MDYKHYICVFKSKNMAVYMLTILERLGHKNFQLISTPCGIKAGCSYSIKFSNMRYFTIIEREAIKIGAEIEGVYLAERRNGRRIIKKVII
ncbi:conserved hypothetical protein [[Clostridium] ultunense Esp]|uniref:Putative Se/S carrier protein-like domain-containing protein n=1 Tax=[Clostridium] ultunense Esp TaxID=1288971 RepID=M1ZGN4_9FIRM|nr:putative Se/S carrier-like protein [Schnuerera ultunensis]CCQ97599.1 conserved hypothetical protein [[Clostridium] ultunense Esp]SHD77231.1 conserved protein of unknown function [[Clostridium] ultunense Esp]